MPRLGLERKRWIILFSGGIDSAAACKWITAKGWAAEALLLRRAGQRDSQRYAAMAVADKLDICLHLLNVESPTAAYCDLISGMPHDDAKLCPDTRPFAELAVWMSTGASLAVGRGAAGLVLGLTAENKRDYPYVSHELVRQIGNMLNSISGHQLQFLVPFVNWSKSRVLSFALKKGVPIEETWSCEGNGAKHCGECRHCLDRKDAFVRIGSNDPTQYLCQ